MTQCLVLSSQQESDRQQNTCVFLKRQNEQMQEDCDELNEQIQSLKVYRLVFFNYFKYKQVLFNLLILFGKDKYFIIYCNAVDSILC